MELSWVGETGELRAEATGERDAKMTTAVSARRRKIMVAYFVEKGRRKRKGGREGQRKEGEGKRRTRRDSSGSPEYHA